MHNLENLEKAQRISLTMQVEISLKGALITGSLKPGARLITKEIANKLGTSITPVREALLRLVSAGALHATPAQAFLVPEVTLDRYNEINAIRKQLEPMAVAAACRHMSDSKLRTLRELSDVFHGKAFRSHHWQSPKAHYGCHGHEGQGKYGDTFSIRIRHGVPRC